MASSRAFPSRSRGALLLACLAASLQAPLQAQQPAQQQPQQQAEKSQRPKDLDALFQQFRSMRGMSASYTEKKHLSLLVYTHMPENMVIYYSFQELDPERRDQKTFRE